MRNLDPHSSSGDDLFADLAGRLEAEAGGRPPIAPEEGWRLVRAHAPTLGEFGKVDGLKQERNRPRASRWTHWPLGATMLMLVALTIGVLRVGIPRITSHSSSKTYVTSAGQRLDARLRDGTRVMLAPNTRLTVTIDAASHQRTIALVGQAYFDVVANTSAPFVVKTGAVTTRVLGTAFDVRRYASDSVTRVVVTSGKVVSGSAHTSATLVAGFAGVFSDSTTIATYATDPSTYTDWTRGRLAFNDTPVPVMLETLSRWYDCKFLIQDQTLAKREVTAVFDINSRAETLRLLKRLLRVTMTIDDSVIVLRPDSTFTGSPTPRPRGNINPFIPSKEFGR